MMLVYLVLFGFEANSQCIEWFAKSGLKGTGKNCEVRCSTLKVDMSTFMCKSECKDLCKEKKAGNTSVPGKLIFYPGLNPAERKLLDHYPKDSLTVFFQKERAESASERNFPTGGFNDESDAFRHFMWAALLVEKIGEERARTFLNAHESNPIQPENERAMDLANNEAGIQAFHRLQKIEKFNFENLEAEAMVALKNKKLAVLKPGLPIPEVKK